MSIAGIVTQLGAIDDIVTRGLTPGEAVAEVIEAFSGGYFDFESVRIARKPKFKPRDEDEKEAKPVLEDIAEQLTSPGIDTRRDMEIVLRMRLRNQGIKYKNLYLKWLQREHKIIKQEVVKEIKRRKKKKRQQEEALILLALFK
jgi:hypothetical protein